MTALPVFALGIKDLPASELSVLSLRGREEISRPYHFDVHVETRLAEIDTVRVGDPAALTISAAGTSRVLHGIVQHVAAVGFNDERKRADYRLRIVSPLAALRRSKNSRVFQDSSVPQIIDAILAPRGIGRRWKVSRSYPPRPYTVQYVESDLAFVQRLLADEGIFYFIEPGAEADVVVLCDLADHYEPIPGAPVLPVRSRADGSNPEDAVVAFSLRRALRPEESLVAGYDSLRPTLEASADATLGTLLADPEKHKTADPGRRVYDHERDFDPFRVSEDAARVHLEQHRRTRRVGEGSSTSMRLAPGYTFTLEGHSLEELNREYAVVALHHEGSRDEGTRNEGGDEAYLNRLVVVPAKLPYRPKRPKRVVRQALEPATVVGPPGEEIHVDDHGRIKVQFHWDRDGKNDDHSSCWIRVMTPWAGPTWGFQFIPRVGMEVVVGFFGGDPDRPIVLGSAFNGTHVPPYPAAQKTVSALRTMSTPGGAGYNELRFEDAASREQILLKAQRDFDELVGNDHSRTVAHDERIQIGNQREITVQGDNVRTVKGNEIVTIEKNFVLHVLGKQTIIIDGGSADGPAPPGASSVETGGTGGGGASLSGPGQPGASAAPTAAQADAAAAAANVSFAVEQLPDDAYAAGAAIREESKRLNAATDTLSQEVSQIADQYVRATASGAPLPKEAVEAAAGLRRRADLLVMATEHVEKSFDATLARVAPSEGALAKVEAAFDAQVKDVVMPAIGRIAKQARLLSQMAGTVVDSDGMIAPALTLVGSGFGGGGGDNQMTANADGKGSAMKILGKGEIDAPDGLTLKSGDSVIEITSGGINIKAPKVKIDGGTVDVLGKPIKLNC